MNLHAPAWKVALHQVQSDGLTTTAWACEAEPFLLVLVADQYEVAFSQRQNGVNSRVKNHDTGKLIVAATLFPPTAECIRESAKQVEHRRIQSDRGSNNKEIADQRIMKA